MDNGTSNGMIMPVSPMYGGYGNGGGFGWGGEGAWWLIILFLFAAMSGFGGWGGGFGGGFGGGLGIDFPWLLNGQQGINSNTNAGFNQAATQSALGDIQTALTSGFGNVQTALCSGFAGVNATVNGAQNAVSQQLYTNQIADMERSFAAQTANTQGHMALQSQLAQCCCDNRLATAQTQALVQSENCADRQALSEGIRDIIVNQTANTQKILDQLCNDKIDAKNDEIANLRQSLAMKDLAASQIAQNAFISQGFANEVDQLYNRLNNCPVPTTPVYGRTPIFTCNNNGGCGCGCNGGF